MSQISRASGPWAVSMVLVIGAATASTPQPSRSSNTCATCHDLPSSTSHPVGVRARAIPGLPLENGRMDCGTCHLESVLGTDHAMGTSGEPHLRLPASELCVSCHGTDADQNPVLFHAILTGRAHASEPGPGAPGFGLDQESRACLACHDGSAAPFARIVEGQPGGARSRMPVDLERDHPVGVDYDPWKGSGTAQLHPQSSLPPTVQLPGGRLGCNSCHSTYSGLPRMLSVEQRGSRLCLTCHVK